MNRRRWIIGEIDQWESMQIISKETAHTLKGIYENKSTTGLLMIIFSIIGSALIGAGIILISARNWYEFPIWFRVVIAFTPLILSQILCGFVVLKKMDSLAWREGSAIFLTLSVFTAIALVGQIFHIPGDYGKYILTCGLLSLPVIYILNAVSPTIIYFWTILNWTMLLDVSGLNDYTRFWIIALLALIAPFILINFKREKLNIRNHFLLWLCVISGFLAILAINLELGIVSINFSILAVFIYFLMIYVMDAKFFEHEPYNIRPLKLIGGLGIVVLMFVYSYSGIWEEHIDDFQLTHLIPYFTIIILMFLISVYYFIKIKNCKLERMVYAIALFTAIAASFISNFDIITFIPAGIVNILILIIGTGILLRGIRETQIGYLNLGMIIICLLIIMRFFDWQMEFLSKGIVFVILGIGFLSANIYISKKRKAAIDK